MRANHSTQLQARWHRYGHRHPDAFAHQLDPEFIGLHLAKFHLPLSHQMSVDVLAVLARTCLPLSNRTLIKTEGRHNGLERTPVA